MAESDVEALTVPDGEAQMALDVPRREIQHWLATAKGRPLKFLVAGGRGVGKSALINNLLEVDKDNENATIEGEPSHIARFTTTSVTKHELQLAKYGIKVVAFDTPGFQDPDIDDADIIAQMVQKTGGHIDVFLYCASLRQRISRVEHTICKLLTKSFGNSIWKKTIFVLTWSNVDEVEQQPADEYAQIIANSKKELQNAVRKAGVPEDIVANIPACTAGHKDPFLKQMEKSYKGSWQDRLYAEIFRRADPALLEFTGGNTASPLQLCGIFLGSVGAGVALGAAFANVGPIGIVVGAAIGFGGLSAALNRIFSMEDGRENKKNLKGVN